MSSSLVIVATVTCFLLRWNIHHIKLSLFMFSFLFVYIPVCLTITKYFLRKQLRKIIERNGCKIQFFVFEFTNDLKVVRFKELLFMYVFFKKYFYFKFLYSTIRLFFVFETNWKSTKSYIRYIWMYIYCTKFLFRGKKWETIRWFQNDLSVWSWLLKWNPFT